MSDQWYYRMFDEEFGPMPFEELQQLAEFGTLSAIDEVRSAASSDWVAAASVDGLGLSGDTSDTTVVACEAVGSDFEVTATRQAPDGWYCMLGGQELGPLMIDELIDYVEHEQLTADDEVKLGDHGKWRRVGSIGRLMAVIPYQAVEKNIVPTPPKSKNPVVEQPTVNDLSDLVRDLEESDWKDCSIPEEQPAVPGPAANRATPKGRPRPAHVPSAPKSDPVINTVARNRPHPDPEPPAARERPTRTESIDNSRPSSPVPTPEPRHYSTLASSFGGMSSSSTPVSRLMTPPRKVELKPIRSSGPSWISGVVDQLKEPKAIGSLVAVVLIALFFGWSYLPKSKAADIKRYQALKQILNELRAARENPSARAALATKATKLGKEMTEAVKKQANTNDPAKQYLLWAARDEIPRIFGGAAETQAGAEQNFASRLQEAAVELGLESRAAMVASIKSAELPDD